MKTIIKVISWCILVTVCILFVTFVIDSSNNYTPAKASWGIAKDSPIKY